MKQSFIRRKILTILALLLVGAGTISCLYPPSGGGFEWWEAHAFEWMLFLLFAGLLFFIINRSRLMYICFAGCAFVCYTLQERTSDGLTPAVPSENAFTLRLGSFHSPDNNSLLDSTLRAMIETGTDILAIRNIKPVSFPYIQDFLTRHGYRSFRIIPDYQRHLKMAIYTRPAMKSTHSIHPCKAPVISGRMNLSTPMAHRELYLFYTNIAPDSANDSLTSSPLYEIGRQIGEMNVPVIALGNFNLVPWSYELQHFKKVAALRDSQALIRPTSRHNYPAIFHHPTDHIFYSDHFKCISFEVISDDHKTPIGVVGTYQFDIKARSANVTQTSQEL